nr:probable inactive receptor kinase At5g67200 [Ipomoea batatas]
MELKSTKLTSATGNHNMEDVMCSPQGGNNEQQQRDSTLCSLTFSMQQQQRDSTLCSGKQHKSYGGATSRLHESLSAATMEDSDGSFETSFGVFPFVK